MIITPELEYPIVCVSVKQAYEPNRYKLDLINMNSGASWFHSDELQDMDGTATVIPKRENLNIVNVTQLDKESILVCYDNLVKIITPQGKLRMNKKQVSELKFDFNINSISKWFFSRYKSVYNFVLAVCLPDSVLAFHKHGMQGRSFKNGDITQEITDASRTYKLLGSDKYVLETKNNFRYFRTA